MKPTTRIAALALVAAAAVLVGGCAGEFQDICAVAPVMPPGGVIFAKQRAPLMFSSQIPDTVVASVPAAGTAQGTAGQGVTLPANLKCGTSQATNIVLYYRVLSVGWGDCSIEAAARSAGIKRIAFADYELLSVLGLFNQITVRVFGE